MDVEPNSSEGSHPRFVQIVRNASTPRVYRIRVRLAALLPGDLLLVPREEVAAVLRLPRVDDVQQLPEK